MGLRCGVFILLLFPLLSQGEVTYFRKCSQFFVNHDPPTILSDPTDNNRYKQICQCLLNNNKKPHYFYATLYDTRNKIPVYSAYELQHADIKRKDYWKLEPQLDGGSHLCMSGLNQIPPINRGDHQALNRDYEKSKYDKGHLYPVYHTSTRSSMLATFTLTNAAPQGRTFNRGHWRVHEENLTKLLKKRCSKVYVVTGVVPGNTQIGNGVKVAKYYWSAYCCVSKRGTTKSAGYIGPDNNGKVQTLTVKYLETILSGPGYYGSPFYVFPGGC